jgi:hypothetical protein
MSEKYLANRLKYHAASRIASQEGEALLQALTLDGHTVVTSKVWAGTRFPVNNTEYKKSKNGSKSTLDLVKVFKEAPGTTSEPFNGGTRYTNTNYDVELYEDVDMTAVDGSNGSGNNYESYEVLSGTVRLQDWVSPMAAFDPSINAPIPGFTGIFYSSADGSTFTELGDQSTWVPSLGNWEFAYIGGMLTFDASVTPVGKGQSNIKLTAFRYCGEYLSEDLADTETRLAAVEAQVGGGSGSDSLASKVAKLEGVTSGYTEVASISGAISGESATRKAADDFLSGAIDDEVERSTKYDSFLSGVLSGYTSVAAVSGAIKDVSDSIITVVQPKLDVIDGEIDFLSGAIDDEVTARKATDSFLSGVLSGYTNVAAVSGAITGAVAAQEESFTLLSGALGGTFDKDHTVANAIEAVKTSVTDEIDPRLDAIDGEIEFLSGAIDAEVTSRNSGDTFISGTLLSGFTAEKTVSGEFDAIRELISDVQTSAIEIAEGNGIDITTLGNTTTQVINVKIANGEKVLSASENGLSAAISLVKLGAATDGYAASYRLQGINGAALGDTINIPKDQFLKDAVFIAAATSEDQSIDKNVNIGEAYIKFTFTVKSESINTDRVVYVNVNKLVDTYTAGNGIDTIGSDNVIKVKIDDTSESFLSVDTDGIKLSGVQTAIDSAKSELNGAIGGTFDSSNTVKKYIDDQDSGLDSRLTAVEAQVGGSSGSGSLASRVAEIEGAISAYTSTDTISGAISAEVSARESAISAIDTAYKAADTALGGRIDGIDAAYKAADTALGGRIDSIKATYEAADTALGGRIDTVSGDVETISDKIISGFSETNTVKDYVDNKVANAICWYTLD